MYTVPLLYGRPPKVVVSPMDSTRSIDVYTICWNEERMLPYFLRHYGQFARRIVVFDNHSTDATAKIAQSHPRTMVRKYGASRHQCGEAERMALREEAWKESRDGVNWVIFADCDEFLWHPNLTDYLQQSRRRSVTVPKPTGYEMIARQFPDTSAQIYEEIRNGVRADYLDKWVVFDPQAVVSMNYSVGCHRAYPLGKIVFDESPALKLLHYRHLGLEYVLSRYRQLEKRRTEQDQRMQWNYHYTWSDQEIANWFNQAVQQAVDVV